MNVIEDYCRGYDSKKYQGKKYSKIFNNVKMVIMPMVNPDGVTISQYGPKKIRNATLRKNLYKIAKGFSFKEWKANARGVDINRNYAEGFNRKGAKAPAHKNYPGKTPVSEPETKAQISVVEKVKPNVVICYLQAAGRVIRTDNDKGIILLLDDRFLTKEYELQYPREWDKIYPCDASCVSEYIDDFWKGMTADD